MAATSVFDSKIPLPDDRISLKARTLLGFEARYARVKSQLQLLLRADELEKWSQKHYGKRLALVDLAKEQYPLVIFHGDVGTGKTAMAEAISNRLVAEARVEDSQLFKLGNRVRGSGKVGEMGTLISEAFTEITKASGSRQHAVLIIDEGDSLGASRAQEHSHHEDKVAVNTLIQSIDGIRKAGGRIVVILCTNRLSVLDPAIVRRASIVERFARPTEDERAALFNMDLADLGLKPDEVKSLVKATGEHSGRPRWTYSDIRTRLYPTALAQAFPDAKLGYQQLADAASTLQPSPVIHQE